MVIRPYAVHRPLYTLGSMGELKFALIKLKLVLLTVKLKLVVTAHAVTLWT